MASLRRTHSFILMPSFRHVSPFEVPILPIGNLLSSDVSSYQCARQSGLGDFAVLSDDLIVRLVDTISTSTNACEATTLLCHFSAASRFTFAFASDDDVWRRLAFQLFSPSQLSNAPFTHSWRATLLRLLSGTRRISSVASPPAHVFSDVLFHKQRCRITPIDEAWLCHDDIPRVCGSSLQLEEFRQRFESLRRPVVLTNIVTAWPAFRDWDPDVLAAAVPEVTFNAGGFPFTLLDYFHYCNAVHAADDQALYIFDAEFARKAPQLDAAYTVPRFFPEDLFDVLGGQRPDFRWFIAGPPRSGSSFHKDPNATSAWNAAVRGRKKWIFFPPDATPPGITPTADGANVTAPLSVMEWFVNFYDRDMITRSAALETVVQPGELIFVPRGWWHCVLNLDLSIAITQNFVSSVNVKAVAKWVRDHPQQISGCKSSEDATYLSLNFAKLVAHKYPHLRNQLLFVLDKPNVTDHDSNDHEALPSKKRKIGLWESLQTSSNTSTLGSSSTKTGSFSFGF